MAKTLGEIQKIARECRLESLEDLSWMDLSVLLTALNRYRVPLDEETKFCDFYMAVVEKIRHP